MLNIVSTLTSTQKGRHRYALILMILSMLAFPTLDAVAKMLMEQGYALLHVAGARFFFQSLFILGLFIYSRHDLTRIFTHLVPAKIYMTLSNVALTLGFYMALQHTSVSIALAVLFTSPIITLIFSHFILNERITTAHIVACLIGFIGTMLIIRPGTDSFNSGALFALIAACGWTGMNITSRIYGENLNAKETQCFSGIVSTAIYIIGYYALTDSTNLFVANTQFWMLAIFIGVTSAVLYISIQVAHTYAPASTLAPFQYMEMIAGLILDYILWYTTPDFYSWIGINVIIISGLLAGRSRTK